MLPARLSGTQADRTAPSDGAGAGLEPDPAPQLPRRLEAGWWQRHVQWQAAGIIPAGRTPMRFEDGSIVYDRLGRPRIWSEHVAVVMQPGRRSSRVIAREAEKAAAAVKLQAQVQRGFKPPAGKLFGVDVGAQLVIGPLGAIGIKPMLARTLAILAAGGRHPVEALVAAGWRDEAHLLEGLNALGPKLCAIGLRVDRRKTGLRIGKLKPGGGAQ